MPNVMNQELKKTKHWITGALGPKAPAEIRNAAIQRIGSAFRIARGEVTIAARILECTPATCYRWVRVTPELAAALSAAREVRA